jgi:O-antigen/teichoic acid export membrane protein
MRYFKNTSWMLGEQILRMIVGLFVGLWVARYLGPEQFGVFNYATAFVAMFGSVAKLGLDGIVVRELVNEPDKRDIYLGTAFWLKIVGAALALCIVAFATLFTSNNHTTNLYIFIIASGIILQSFEVIDFYFQSKVLSKFVSLSKITQLVFSSLLKAYIITGADLFWFVVVSLVDQATLAATLYVVFKFQKLGSFYRHFDWGTAKIFLKDSWPLIISSLVVVTHMCIDRVVIKEMLGEREVGIYSAAVRLSELWYFIPMIITFSLFPAIVSAKKESEEYYYVRLQQLYTFMVWVAIGIALPMTILSDWLVTLLYGEAYREAGRVLAIHIWGVIFIFHVSMRSSSLLVENKQKYVTVFAILTLGTHLLLNFYLINLIGVVGAAYASLVSWFLCACLFPLFLVDTRQSAFMFYKSFVPRYST